MIKHLNKVLNITAEEIKAELAKRCNVRLAQSKKYTKNERVTPIDTRRAKGRDEYLFVSSIRWGRNGDYGGYLLFNPRTCKLISATNIVSLDNPGNTISQNNSVATTVESAIESNKDMKDKQTIAQTLKIKDFPFRINDKNGNQIYYENSNGYWIKYEFGSNGKVIYYENSDGFWCKREYDSNGKKIYFEESTGYIKDNRPKKIIELTIEDIAKLKGVDASLIRIKE